MKLGSTDINKVYLGSTEINEIYLGATLVYEVGGPPPAGGWDLANATYDSVSFSVAGQEGVPLGVFFSPNGLKMYITGAATDRVHQYTLSTAWLVSSSSYDNVSFNLSGQDGTPYKIFFKPDGLKMYMVGQSTSSVYQYTLSTAWDVSSASYDSVSFSVNTQDDTPRGLFIKSDGTTFYVCGDENRTIYQYTMSTAWDLSTASYASASFSVNTQESDPRGIFFKPDGTTLFVVGVDNDNVYQYTLTSPWDISSAGYDTITFDVSSQEGVPSGLFFKEDGTLMYIIGPGSDAVFQYTVPAP